MTDFREQLQTALGSAYSLRTELGGGGMSRVFLAYDPSLGREIVVKTLHPELASAVNTDRFKREIQLAAQLQHPHIVPILAAGEMDGLPFLTMPYVAGRSLRERLVETPMLPIAEACDLLRDVARALAFAHGRGVIHRDIKPDNVLLAEGSATVTDFGVAKAVSAAMSGGAGSTLTSVGTSIGTPTYMAPEQAAGDPNTDHRADIYAWGVMAYEVLAGRPPFVHKVPHKLLAAHMMETPEPITDHRPDCPPALASVVMQCLAKDPAMRPQSASDLLRGLAEGSISSGGEHNLPAISVATRRTLVKALGIYAAAFILVAALAQTAVSMVGLPDWVLPGTLVVMALGLPVVLFTAFVHHGNRVARTMAILTPGGTINSESTMTRIAVRASPHVSWKRTATGGAIAVGAFAALVVAFMVLRAFGIGPAGSLFAKGVLNEKDQILVADFESPASDSTLGPVVSEGVRTGLGQSRSIRVVQPSAVAGALQRMQRPSNTRVTGDVAREVAEREGYKAIVAGKITPVGASGSYILTVSLLTPSGDQLAAVQETAKDATQLIPAIDQASRSLRGKLGESLKTVRETMRLERATTASLPALRKFTEAVKANERSEYPRAIAAVEEAIKLDSNFAMAYRLGALAYNNAGIRLTRRDSLRQRSFELRDRLPDLERALVEATYYDGGEHADRARAIEANLRVLEVDPTAPQAWNGLGLLYAGRRDYVKAESAYRKVLEYHPEVAVSWNSLALAEINAGDLTAAEETLAERRRRFPDLGDRSTAGWLWLLRGQRDSATAFCQRIATASPSAQVRTEGLGCVSAVEETRGHLHAALSKRADARGASAARGVTVADEAAQLDSSFFEAWFYGRTDSALQRAEAMLAAKPLASVPLGKALYNPYIQLFALAGAPDRARTLLTEYEKRLEPDTARRRLATSELHNLTGQVAVAEKRYDVALHELALEDSSYDHAPVACGSCTVASLARAHDLAGHTDQAIALFERYLSTSTIDRVRDTDPTLLAGTYKRLGELYEQKGDRERAISNYTKFVDLWKTADPELQPKVADARRRLAALTRAEKR